MAKERINSILILQGWAMLWVIIGHAPLDSASGNPTLVQWLYDIAYSFHMPLFVFVSGYLFQLTRIARNTPYGDMMCEKLTRLGIPYTVFTIIAMAFKTLIPAAVKRQSEISLKEFAYAMICPSDGPLSELWFVMMLLGLFAMYPLWKEYGGKIKAVIIIIALVLIYHIIPDFKPNILSASSICRHAVYFALGVFASRYRGEKLFSRKNIVAVVAAVAIAAASDLLMPWNIKTLQLTISLSGIIFSILIAELCNKYVPRIFVSFRDYTYQIFLMGIFFQIAVKYLYRLDIISNYSLGYILCILIGIYLPVAIALIARRINNRYINLCLGLQSRKN